MCGAGAQGDASHAGRADRENSQPCTSLWLVLQAVTFKWLARRFSVPVNEAKQMLFAFAEKHRYPACYGKHQAADSLQALEGAMQHNVFPAQRAECIKSDRHLPCCCSHVPGKPQLGQQLCLCPACCPLVHAGPR